MQSGETAQQVFTSHRVISKNGYETIVPAELDPHMKGRVVTLLEAQKIIAALTGTQLEQVQALPMFHPTHVAAPSQPENPAIEWTEEKVSEEFGAIASAADLAPTTEEMRTLFSQESTQ